MSSDLTGDQLRLAREATDASGALERMGDLAAILGEAPDPLHQPETEPRHRLAEAAATLQGWAQRLRLEAGADVWQPNGGSVSVDREALVEAVRLIDRVDGYVQTGEGEPSLPNDFAEALLALEDLRRLLHGLVDTADG